MEAFTCEELTQILSAHIPLYAWHPPIYQHIALTNLHRLWDDTHHTALDVGGGTGIIAHAIRRLFKLDRVVSVDIKDRFLPSLDVDTAIFDGVTLPFPDGSFDCVLLFNVLHHVPPSLRLALLRECRRVAGSGPIYIKDHISTGALDDARLAGLDLLGNVPFHGMVRARYLRLTDWSSLAREAAYEESNYLSGPYRKGVFSVILPNRLEMSVRWRRV